MKKPSYIDFDHDKFQTQLSLRYDFRGEIGVLSYPYSKKISSIWRFATPEAAQVSAQKIAALYEKNINEGLQFAANYLASKNDKSKKAAIYRFLRADICRKFILMGYTRSMRYANHRGGRKWQCVKGNWIVRPIDHDPVKLQSAKVFREVLDDLPRIDYDRLKVFYKKHIGSIAYDSNRI